MRIVKWDMLIASVFVLLSGAGVATEWGGLTSVVPMNAEESPEFAECPVCGMNIEVKEETPSTEYNGRVYYFMNDAMKNKFLSNPDSYTDNGPVALQDGNSAKPNF